MPTQTVCSSLSCSAWTYATIAYLSLALVTLIPTLRAVLRGVRLHEGGVSFEGDTHFTEDERLMLARHYSRIVGTLQFWKNQAEKYRSVHFYCLLWTVPISILIPIVAQAISGESVSRLFLTVMSTHAAVLLTFHKGFKVENNFRAFRHGESEFYDMYRRLLDTPGSFGATNQEQIECYFRQVEQIRKYVRSAETDNLPTIEEFGEQLRRIYGKDTPST